MSKVAVIGANSAIAAALARRFAGRKDHLFLAARDSKRLEAIAADLRVRGAVAVDVSGFDALDPQAPGEVTAAAWRALGQVDVAVVAYGSLSDQQRCSADAGELVRELQLNAVSVMTLCEALANRLEQQGRGTLVVLSSVAGDRGRASNYAYGAAKAAVSAFCSGLRQRLVRSGVNVLTVKPGFVDTPMTSHFPKGALWASPDDVAEDIDRAVRKGRAVLYTPWFWRPIMFIVRSVPEGIFARFGPR